MFAFRFRWRAAHIEISRARGDPRSQVKLSAFDNNYRMVPTVSKCLLVSIVNPSGYKYQTRLINVKPEFVNTIAH